MQQGASERYESEELDNWDGASDQTEAEEEEAEEAKEELYGPLRQDVI
jgi:hypothetical protein